MDHQPLVRESIDAAMAFHKRRMWKRFTNFDCFAIRLPGRDDLLLATVMGDAGEQFGLTLFRGPNAVDAFAELTSSDMPDSDLIESMDMLGCSLDRFGDLPPAGQAFFRKVGIHPKHGEQVSGFIVKPPHRMPRMPDDADLSLLVAVLKATVVADKRKLLEPAEVDDENGVCVIAVGGTSPEPTISVTRERLSRRSVVARPEVFAASGVDISGFGRADAQWLVGMPSLPFGIEDDDRSMQLLLIADEASTMVLQATPMFSDETRKAVDQLIEAFERHGVPRSIVFTTRTLHDAVAGVLAQSGVTCSYTPRHPKLAEMTRDFLDHLGEGMPSFDEFIDEQPQDEPIPAPDDLAGWKQADRHLSQRFADHLINGERPRSSRAIKRYFNEDDLEYFFEEHEQRGVTMAYSSWCMLDYRPTRNSKTQAEALLAEPLPPAQEALLRARIAAHPTLYRVTAYDPKAGTVDLEDVLVGGAVTAHDQLLSENIDNGLFMTARVFPAGAFHFMEVAGPPLGPLMGMKAVAFLRDSKLTFTPQGLKRESHKLGWLWGWLDDWQADYMPPRLCNTDGDDMLFHTAAFSVDDSQAVRRALRKRKDIDYDEQADEYVWWKPVEKGSGMLGDSLTLGRIELVVDELVLTVNSAERFAKARKWIDQLPGVKFIDVTTHEAGPSDMPRPMDEQMGDDEPVEITPEMASAIQQRITGHYMGWLDMPLPVLGGKSPRQACRTPAGRDEVTMLIRTMPDPMGDASIHIPREAMLRELGLTLGAPHTAVPGPSNDATFAPPPVAIGRNKPCPCGSGRKYKHCCGR
jgi:hypothetical protein